MSSPRVARTVALALLGATLIATAAGFAIGEPRSPAGCDPCDRSQSAAPVVTYSLQ